MLLAAAAASIVKSRRIDEPQLREDTIKSIRGTVAYLFALSVEQLRRESNRRVVAMPSQIALHLANQMTDAFLPIGRHFGAKHHTSVPYSVAKIDERRRIDLNLNKVGSEGSEKWAGSE
jgi:chromosomal replication initiation ATPase DnaA